MSGRTARRRVVRISLAGDGRPGGRDGRADLLAAELAAGTGLTLIGFLRGSTMNVYAGEQRVAAAG